ncbi:hypothetical protein SLEP1_g16340 [Rubroshorea leprosula]|uniref:Reverse transcriptase zinc-binding domain-containing protein n=1 Tax=Rubroshorea leprosula TaxID=152421 RepID=A0AAV5IQI1_9ROSI|nr:hypothetical protein SLEP1_g16340 [Rubroshorea leprosula]
MGHWNGNTWSWNLRWRRELHTWEDNQVEHLHQLLSCKHPQRAKKDSWCWSHEKKGQYSVKSAYQLLLSCETNDCTRIMKKCWNKMEPNKVCSFAWLLLQNRIPSKDNLLRREAIKEAMDARQGFIQHLWAARNKQGWQVVWHAVVWSIWSARNAAFFGECRVTEESMLKIIQSHSYFWLSGKSESWPYSFLDWVQNPSRCLVSKRGKHP